MLLYVGMTGPAHIEKFFGVGNQFGERFSGGLDIPAGHGESVNSFGNDVLPGSGV